MVVLGDLPVSHFTQPFSPESVKSAAMRSMTFTRSFLSAFHISITAAHAAVAPKKPVELPRSPVCDLVRFMAAAGSEQAMVGGVFEGSNTLQTEGFVKIGEIKAVPKAGEWTELKLDNAQVYRWLQYRGPKGVPMKLAEVAFFSGERKLSGVGLSYSLPTDTGGPRKNAFDDNPKTVFESSADEGGIVGVDLRDQATGRTPWFAPAPMQPSKDPASTFVTLHKAPLKVEIRSAPENAVIRYTLDGSWPSETNGIIYREPIVIERTTTLQAVSFLAGHAASPPMVATYLMKDSVKPGLSTFHWGNSLTQTTSQLAPIIRTSGHMHRSAIFARPGAWTKELWDIGLVQEKDRAMGLWNALDHLDHVTVQPRDFDIAEEAGYDIKFFNMAREKSPDVQPWLYCEWTEWKRLRPTDLGKVPSRQMKKTFPALTWEESMGAMLLYMEDLQSEVCDHYTTGKRPRVLPTALAMGWIRNMIDHGQLPGIAKGSFYPLLFADQVHPTTNPLGNVHGNGGYLVDLTWFAAFYGESPEGQILPIGTTFTKERNAIIQRLAWDVIANYPDCGLYREGTETCGKPEFTSDGKTITLKSSTPGAWFRYTLDGTEPTRTRGYVYCGAISEQPGIQLKVIAYKSGMKDSVVVDGK